MSDELATAILMNIYNQVATARAFAHILASIYVYPGFYLQNSSISALAGLVGLTPLAAGSSSLYRADKGNYQIWNRAVEKAASLFVKNTRVLSIKRERNSK